MSISRALLKAKTIGIRKFRDKLSKLMKTHEMFVVTEHGHPTSVVLPYNDIMEIVDILDELRDKNAIKAVTSGRKSISSGVKGILAKTVFKRK